jgi:hypothetical protein
VNGDSGMTPARANVRGDNADEVIRLRDALTDAEYQSARWVADAAKWERYADALQHALGRATAALEDIAAADGNGYCGQRARGALDGVREALEAGGWLPAASGGASA